jgi:hypothetical protein
MRPGRKTPTYDNLQNHTEDTIPLQKNERCLFVDPYVEEKENDYVKRVRTKEEKKNMKCIIEICLPPNGLTFQLLMKDDRLCAVELSLLVKSFSALPSNNPHRPAVLFHKFSVTSTPT